MIFICRWEERPCNHVGSSDETGPGSLTSWLTTPFTSGICVKQHVPNYVK